MGVNYNPKIVTDGLVLCLDAANRRSYPGAGVVWTDLSGMGNNGTLVNGVAYNSGNGGSLSFDGANDRINFPFHSSLNIGGLNLTLSTWFRATALANSFHGAGVLVRESGSNNGLYEFLLINRSSKNYPYFRINGVGTYEPNLIEIELNKTYNVVCVYDNGVMRNYVNAVQEGSGLSSNVNISTNASRTIRIGDRFSAPAPFSGNIFNASIYNIALTPQEIQQNFNATRGRFGI